MFSKKALVTKCQRQQSDREMDWDPAEGECYVRGDGNRGEAFNNVELSVNVKEEAR